jgi:hypothetical protein
LTTPTIYRDKVSQLAKTDPAKGVEIAKTISDPWFQAQAWSHLARWADDPFRFSRHAAKSASETKDDYQRSAVRAWEVAALAERGYFEPARRSLQDAVGVARTVEPISSRAEALILLFQAAFKISVDDAKSVAEVLNTSCASDHWRAKRASKYIQAMLSDEMRPREFFW